MTIGLYSAQYLIIIDSEIRQRVSACVGIESDEPNPDEWSETHKWEWATAPGWAGKVQAAVNAGNGDWGRDPAVITDGDILSVIQPMVSGSA